MKRIELTQNKTAIVDDDKFLELSKYKWYAFRKNSLYYAARNVPNPSGKHSQKRILMHRVVAEATSGFDVDHLNGEGLDNRISNLRVCTHAVNCGNRGLNKNSTSGVRGVHFDKSTNLWRYTFRKAGMRFSKRFRSKGEAILASRPVELELFGVTRG